MTNPNSFFDGGLSGQADRLTAGNVPDMTGAMVAVEAGHYALMASTEGYQATEIAKGIQRSQEQAREQAFRAARAAEADA